MRMKLLHGLAIVPAMASVVMLTTPANASTAGVVVFAGTVTLPVFPCTPSCGVTGTPNEAAPLVFTATVAAGAGVTTTPAGAGVVTGLTARVHYSEPACVNGEALTGRASGTATLTGVNVVGAPLPLTIGFHWLRVGLVAVVTSFPLPDPPPPVPPVPPVPTPPFVVGAAVFVPTSGAPSCTGAPLTAVVAGAAALVSP